MRLNRQLLFEIESTAAFFPLLPRKIELTAFFSPHEIELTAICFLWPPCCTGRKKGDARFYCGTCCVCLVPALLHNTLFSSSAASPHFWQSVAMFTLIFKSHLYHLCLAENVETHFCVLFVFWTPVFFFFFFFFFFLLRRRCLLVRTANLMYFLWILVFCTCTQRVFPDFVWPLQRGSVDRFIFLICTKS